MVGNVCVCVCVCANPWDALWSRFEPGRGQTLLHAGSQLAVCLRLDFKLGGSLFYCNNKASGFQVRSSPILNVYLSAERYL